MPMFVLGRNHRLASVMGHNIVFQKGEPTHVPPECIPEVVAIGAECVDGPIDVLPPEVKEQIPMTADEREQMLFAAFDEYIARNNPDEFTAAGVPKTKLVAKTTGISDLDTKELQAAWQKHREMKAQ